MPNPGDVVTVDFMGATGMKRRPAVVVSSDLYHIHRPDIVLAALTTQIPKVIGPFDYILQDWQDAGLHQESVFRPYFNMSAPSINVIGHLSARDWNEVKSRLHLTFNSEIASDATH